MENQDNNFMEKVDEFLELSKSTTAGITSLRDSIHTFTTNIKELKKLPELNESLTSVSKNMELLDNCHKQLEDVFSKVDKFKDIEHLVAKHNENFEIINETLFSIGDFVNRILVNSDNLNIESIADTLSNLTEKFEELNYYITEYIIKTFNEKLNNSVFLLKQELTTLQKSFNDFRSESIRMTNEFRRQNESIKEQFADVIKSNMELMALMKNMEKNNSDGEKYLNNVIEKWYIENIGFLGMKKKDDVA